MKQSDVPVYNDPVDFENGENIYPCSTQFMVYNGLLHKYFLTEEKINAEGIDVERRYISDSANKMRDFIKRVTDTVYNYIQYKTGWRTYQVMLYRIATCPKQIIQDPYAFRKSFEDILAIQAHYIIDNGISSKYSNVDLSKGKPVGIAPSQDFRDNADVSDLVKHNLAGLGLDRWFMLPGWIRLDPEKY